MKDVVFQRDDNLIDVSKSKAKKIDGIDKKCESVSAFLIGQLGKNTALEDNPINLSEIFDEVHSVIDRARKLVGGRLVILECERNARLIQLYRDHGYDILIDVKCEKLITMSNFIC